MSKTQWANFIQQLLAKRYPISATMLNFANPWELLVATVLAAQCTDARVNLVTPELFRRWPDAAALALAPLPELETIIHSTGFFHNKAKNLIACAKILTEKHQGEMPRSIDELVKLPGVARKTANVILFGAFGINEGIAVDTHVRRISYRLGLTDSQDPVLIERHLMELFAQEEWGNINLRMVSFGRDICKARGALCSVCELAEFCPKREPEQKPIRSRKS